MKKILCITLAAVILLCGCKKDDSANKVTLSNIPLTAKNEIISYTKVDAEKTQIIIATVGNVEAKGLCDEFEKTYNDIQVICIDITGGNNKVSPIADWLKNGYTPDVVISTSGLLSNDDAKEYLENLSQNKNIENYEAEALNRTSIDGHIYWLPGPSDIVGMMYNKTLFNQYGWDVPITFDEFVNLCIKIREDTNGTIQPWNPNAKYSNELDTVTEGFVYEELFGGMENRAWYNNFIEGKETFSGHMEPYYDMISELAENKILTSEHFDYSATTRGIEFSEGKIAMINSTIKRLEVDKYEFGYMAFPTTKGSMGYLCNSYSCYVGIPKKERSDAERQATDSFIDFFSSKEGQQAYIGDSVKISNVKNAFTETHDALIELKPTIEAGHMFKRLDFSGKLGKTNFSLRQGALDITNGISDTKKCISSTDAQPYLPHETNTVTKSTVIATATTDLTVLETSFYIADAYRAAANADIGLISHNCAFRGNLMRIFSGEITADFLSVLKPRSFENDSALLKVKMTGKQILEAINLPPNYNNTIANCIYAFSGLKCEVAPWNPLGEKYVSVKLADGSALELDKSYTVAIWKGTVDPSLISETIKTFDDTFENILTKKMSSDKEVMPNYDERITLIWE